MKYIKKYENIEWEFEDEEIKDVFDYPIHLKELSREEYEKFLKELKIGDRFNFTFKKDNKVYNSDGTIRYKKINFGIEFDENIGGHNGKSFNGKRGHCWFFNNNKSMNYGLIINKRV